MRWEGKLVPTETGHHRFHMKSFGPKRMYLDGKELPCNYFSVEFYTVPVDLQAGKEYDFRFETSNAVAGAFRAQLFGRPRRSLPGKRPLRRRKTRPAPCTCLQGPSGSTSGQGGPSRRPERSWQTPRSTRSPCWSGLAPSCPWDRLSSTRPRSPQIRSSCVSTPGQTAASPCTRTRTTTTTTRRAYTPRSPSSGTMPITGSRSRPQGDFPGMLKDRTFNVVLVTKDHGTGIEVTDKADKVVSYTGAKQVVQLPH